MNTSNITVRYAKALFQLAVEENQLQAVYSDMHDIAGLMAGQDDFRSALLSPIIKDQKKTEIVKAIFENQIARLSFDFMLLLIKNHRINILEDICRYFEKLYRKSIGIQSATITTAKPLSAQHKEEILQYIQKHFHSAVDLVDKVDPHIVGGFCLRIEDQQIDASISTKLKKIKHELINS